LALAASLALGLSAPIPPPEAEPVAPCPPAGTDRAALVCEINAARAKAGSGPLQPRPSLHDAARAHATDMVERGYFAHVTPEGRGPVARIRRAGYLRRARRWRVGETLLWRRGGAPLTAADAVAAWLASPPHRRVLLASAYEDVGVGLVAGAPLGDPGLQPAATLVVNVGRR
jgi:uncharacterized protein YkwD